MNKTQKFSSAQEILNETKKQTNEMSGKLENLLLEKSFDPKKSISNQEYMALYSLVFNCCDFQEQPSTQQISLGTIGLSNTNKQNIHKNEDLLAKFYEEKLINFLQKLLEILQKEQNDLSYLQKSIELLEYYHIYVHWLNKMYDYLNRFHYSNLKTTGQKQGYKFLFERFFSVVHEKLSRICLEFISRERNDEKIPQEEVSKTIQLFIKMSFNQKTAIKLERISNNQNQQSTFSFQGDFEGDARQYKEKFENKLVENIKIFYSQKVQNQWNKLTTSEYVINALKALHEEEQRADRYYSYSKKRVITEIEKILIEQNAASLVNNDVFGAISMLEKDQREDLKNLYTLLKRVQSTIKFLSTKYEKFLVKLGDSITKDQALSKDPIKFIQKIIEVKDTSDDLINTVFNKDMDLIKARDNSFSIVLNHYDKTPFNLALTTDFEMKKGIKGLKVEEYDKKFQQIINLLKYINSRDAFLQHFQMFLKKRLLNNESLDSSAEENLINKLKTEVGGNQCSKIDKMRSDMKESVTIMEQFKKYLSDKKITLGLGLDFSLKILTSNIWPAFDKNEYDVSMLPKELDVPIKTFKTFYSDKFQARNLTFSLIEGDAEVQATFKGQKYWFTGRNLQVIVLMQFNSIQNKRITVQKLSELTKIQMNDLEFILEWLCNPDLKLLLRSDAQGKPDKFGLQEEISVNMDFNKQQKKIRIIPTKANPRNKEQDSSNKPQQDLAREREYILDANIVRVMKARKTLKYSELEAEIVRIVTIFRPQPSDIKKRIELLIERDYIARDEKDTAILIYVP